MRGPTATTVSICLPKERELLTQPICIRCHQTRDSSKQAVTYCLEEGEVEDDKRSHPVAEVRTLFCESSNDAPVAVDHFSVEQRKEPEVLEIIQCAEAREVPVDPHRSRRLVSEGSAHMAWG